MTLRIHIPSLCAALLLTGAAQADRGPAPPRDGQAASQIIRMIEARPDFRHLVEMEWDESGHWEVKYVGEDGRRQEVRLNPRTGETVRR